MIEAYVKKDHNWPLMVSILLYNGFKAPYPYPSETSDYYGCTDWDKKEMYFRFHLIDLTQISDKEILTHGLCAPMEILLKHSRDGDFELAISAYQAVFHACISEIGDNYITSMLVYADSLKNFKIGEKCINL
jgi:predicted transposase YdaD